MIPVEFVTMTIVTCIVLVLIVRFSLHTREPNPTGNIKVILLLTTLAVFSMFLGKYGATWGLPWWIYYPAPMLLVLLLPIVLFRMHRSETIKYSILMLVSSPLIHIFFSLLGWKNYLPFFPIPSIKELI